MVKKIAAIIFIFCCTSVAWMILASTVTFRTHSQDGNLRSAVGQLWGTAQRQRAPVVSYRTKQERVVTKTVGVETTSSLQTEIETHHLPLDASAINVQLNLEHRRKGLLWYSTYRVTFDGKYKISNPLDHPEEILIEFAFPSPGAVYDDFRFLLGGKELPDLQVSNGSVIRSAILAPGQQMDVQIGYVSQGMDDWWYEFGGEVTQVRNFALKMNTDFVEIDFPENSISPTSRKQRGNSWELLWQYENLLSGVRIGMAMPQKLNPGPWVSKVTYAAPVSLFLYFFLLFILSVIRKIKIHPMNYFFLGTAFFSFHLLLAYLADHISIHAAFLLSSTVSILLAVSYMRLVVGSRLAFLEAGLAQFVYLVIFAYTFFFKEFTGLAVTILCILTLFVVMLLTGRLDWERVFGGVRQPQAVTRDAFCPYCRETLNSSSINSCSRCGTLHHLSCWTDHGGCAIFGCAS